MVSGTWRHHWTGRCDGEEQAAWWSNDGGLVVLKRTSSFGLWRHHLMASTVRNCFYCFSTACCISSVDACVLRTPSCATDVVTTATDWTWQISSRYAYRSDWILHQRHCRQKFVSCYYVIISMPIQLIDNWRNKFVEKNGDTNGLAKISLYLKKYPPLWKSLFARVVKTTEHCWVGLLSGNEQWRNVRSLYSTRTTTFASG